MTREPGVEGPVTAAGRRLLASSWKLGSGEPLMLDTILAIEAEAAQAARAEVIAEIRAGVEGLAWIAGFPEYVARDRVLALLPPTADRAEPVGLREARSDALDSAIAIVQQSLDSSRYEAGSNPDKADLMVIAAREHIIKLLTHYRDRIAHAATPPTEPK